MHADTKSGLLDQHTPGAEFERYSMRLWIVLSILMSLTITAIFAKHGMVGLSIIPFLLLPVSLTLYFRARIARLGSWGYAGTLVVVLSAAILFGL